MKKTLLFSMVIFFALSCEDTITTQNKQIVADVTTNTTLSSDFVYQIGDLVEVNKGVVLTIEPGTILLNNQGEVVGPEKFKIEKGGKVVAEATPQLHF
jgi:hypothetical protein